MWSFGCLSGYGHGSLTTKGSQVHSVWVFGFYWIGFRFGFVEYMGYICLNVRSLGRRYTTNGLIND